MAEDTISRAQALLQSGKLPEDKAAKLRSLVAKARSESEPSVAPTAAPEPRPGKESTFGATMASMMLSPEETFGMSEGQMISDIEIERRNAINKNYIQPGEPNYGQSHTNKKKLFSPPVVQAQPPMPGEHRIERPPFMFHEPDVSKALKWASENNMAVAFKDIKERGTGSKYYQEYADKLWSDVAETFVKHGQSAIRVAFQNKGEGSEVPLLTQARGVTDRSMDALFNGFDSIATFTAGRRALGAIQDEGPAEKELEARGIIGSPSERIKEAGDRNMLLNLAGGWAALAIKAGLGGLLFSGLAPALAKSVGPVTGVAVPTFLHGAGEQAVEEIAEPGEGGVLDTLKRIGKRGLDFGTFGGLFGLGAELGGSMGRGLSSKVSNPLTERGRELGELKYAARGVPQTKIFSSKGVRVPKALESETEAYTAKSLAQEEAAQRAAMEGKKYTPELIEHPLDIINARATKAVGAGARRRLDGLGKQIEGEKAAYYATKEGSESIGIKNIGEDAINFVENKLTPSGQRVPLVKTERLEKVIKDSMIDQERTLLLQEKWNYFVKNPVHKTDIAKINADVGVENPLDWKPKDMLPRGLAGSLGTGIQKRGAELKAFKEYLATADDVSIIDGKIYAWRKLNAKNVDDMIDAIDDAAKASAKKAGVVPLGFKELQKSARDLRDKFKWPEQWGPKPTATIEDELGKRTIEGWSATRHKHGLMNRERDNILYKVGAQGTDPTRYRPDISEEHKANLAAKIRQSGTDATFRDLLKDDEQGFQWLLDAVGANAYVRFTGAKPRVALHGGAPSAWAPASLEWLGLHADPIFRGVGKLSGKGSGLGAVITEGYGTPSEQKARDISRMPQEEVDNIVGLVKRFGDALNRGVFDDMIERGE